MTRPFDKWEPTRLASIRIVTCSLLFLIYLPLDDRTWTVVSSVFWMPISLFRLLPGPPRHAASIGALQLLWKLSLLTSAVGLLSRASLLTATGLGYFLLGLPNCFGKIHHLDGFPVLLLAILTLSRCSDAWSLDQTLRHAQPGNPEGGYWQYGWPIRLAQTLFLLIFFAAGLSKLRMSGLAWMTAANMRAIWLGEMYTHTPPTRLAGFFATWPWLCQCAAVATVAIELSALPAIWFRRSPRFTLLGLFSLQLVIALMLGVYFTPHLAGYALFLRWNNFIKPRAFSRGAP